PGGHGLGVDELPLEDLAGGGHGQAVTELHDPRVLVRRHVPLAPGEEVRLGDRGTSGQQIFEQVPADPVALGQDVLLGRHVGLPRDRAAQLDELHDVGHDQERGCAVVRPARKARKMARTWAATSSRSWSSRLLAYAGTSAQIASVAAATISSRDACTAAAIRCVPGWDVLSGTTAISPPLSSAPITAWSPTAKDAEIVARPQGSRISDAPGRLPQRPAAVRLPNKTLTPAFNA